MKTKVVELVPSDLEYVAYGRASSKSLKAYFIGLGMLWVIALPAIVFDSWLWSAFVVAYVALFLMWWYRKLNKRYKTFKAELLRGPSHEIIVAEENVVKPDEENVVKPDIVESDDPFEGGEED